MFAFSITKAGEVAERVGYYIFPVCIKTVAYPDQIYEETLQNSLNVKHTKTEEKYISKKN